MKTSPMIYAATLSALFSLPALAGTSTVDSKVPSAVESPAQQGAVAGVEERQALQIIHMANLTEIKAGLIALDKDISPEARAYARQLIDDRMANEKEVFMLIDKYSIEWSTDVAFTEMMAKDKALLASLEATPSAEFSAVFLDGLKVSRQELLGKLQPLDQNFVGTDISAFVNATIARLQENELDSGGALSSSF